MHRPRVHKAGKTATGGPEHNHREACYQTGFNNVNYFIRQFNGWKVSRRNYR